MEYLNYYPSPLGTILLSSNGDALTGLWFEGQKSSGRSLPSDCEERELPVFEQTRDWLDTFFSGREPSFTPPLAPAGTSFQKEVWNILLTIPYGQTITYGEIAAVLTGRRGISHMSAQAVGGAVGRNPVSLIIPCHRVIGADGSLTGYAGGLDRKAKLLALESSPV